MRGANGGGALRLLGESQAGTWQVRSRGRGARVGTEAVESFYPEAAEGYLRFLRAGSSVSPTAVFEVAGVDMTTPEPVEKAFAALPADINRPAEVAA